jgi:hypothetical protein
MHDSGFERAVFEGLHLLKQIITGKTSQRRDSRLFNCAAFATMAVGAHGGVGSLVEFFGLLGEAGTTTQR